MKSVIVLMCAMAVCGLARAQYQTQFKSIVPQTRSRAFAQQPLYSRLSSTKEVVCFYNPASMYREGQAKFTTYDLQNALNLCTQLVYGYAKVNEYTYELQASNPDLELPTMGNHFQAVTNLKITTNLRKVMLSVGGGFDGDYDKYFDLLATPTNVKKFVESAYQFVKTYGFDGLDLAWQFPYTRPQTSGFFTSIKNFFKSSDKHEQAHRDQFTNLVSELRRVFERNHLQLSLTVLPNVNSTVYYDVPRIINQLDQVHVMAYDHYTAQRYPDRADFIAPLQELLNRPFDANAEYQLAYWTNNFRVNTQKIILGVPTHGRTWRMTSSSGRSGIPPVEVDGPGEAGTYTKEPGFISHAEICTKSGKRKDLQVFNDNRGGAYAFKSSDSNGYGIWISYENQESVRNKANFILKNNLGGLAFNEVGYDDFKGLCTGDKYPLLAASTRSFNVIRS